MDLKRAYGFDRTSDANRLAASRQKIREYVRLRLVASGLTADGGQIAAAAEGLLDNYREQSRLLLNHRCGADRRIEEFLSGHFWDIGVGSRRWLPGRTLVLDRHGMAR